MDYQLLVDRHREQMSALGIADLDPLTLETQIESLTDCSRTGSLADTLTWYRDIKDSNAVELEHIPLAECRGWIFDQDKIRHESGAFFVVEGIRVKVSPRREVGTRGWDQPFLTQVGYDGGILGLIRKMIDGAPHYLVETKFEPGNYGHWQISPSLQATFSNIERAHQGNKPFLSELFLEPEAHGLEVLRSQWLSEDGGRLFNKRNRGMLVQAPADSPLFDELPETFRWVSLWQLRELTRSENAIVGPHVRGILSLC